MTARRVRRFVSQFMTMKKVLVTSALPYANGKVHLGHLAGAYLPADIFVRHLRLKGCDVKFICGSDEHGVPITLQALKRKTTPQQVVDESTRSTAPRSKPPT